MKHPCVCLLFLLLFVFSACTTDTSPVGDETTGSDGLRLGRSIEIGGSVLATGDWLVAPAALLTISGMLLIGEAFSPPFVHIVDPSSGALIDSFGEKGEGPGEFSTIASFSRSGGDSTWAFDANHRRLTLVHPASWRGNAGAEVALVTFEVDKSFLDPHWLGDSLIVGQVFSPDARLIYFDRSGATVRTAGSLPERTDLPATVQPYALHSAMAFEPSGQRVAAGGRWSSMLEIRDLEWQPIAAPMLAEPFSPAFDVVEVQGRPTLAHIDDTTSGYLSLAATTNLVFALFSGKKLGDYGAEAGQGEYVHVLDWAGKLITSLHLDAAAAIITVDEASMTMYAAHWEPIPIVMKYSLRDVIPDLYETSEPES